jgi:putative endonuclease
MRFASGLVALPATAGRHPASGEPKGVLMTSAQELAREGEQAAVDYMSQRGFRVLDRNWRCEDGEIGVVSEERQTLVVCEIKTRAGTRFGTPLEALGRAGVDRLRRLGVRWMQAHGARYDRIRIDVIGMLRDDGGDFTIEHVRGVG